MAFHPYPQLIPQVFNLGGFGPPRDFTRASTWPWIDHSVSGLRPATRAPYSDSLSLRLHLVGLTLLLNVTRRLIMQKARRRTERIIVLRLLVNIRFQGLFHSPLRGAFHLSLAVLVHYRSPGSI